MKSSEGKLEKHFIDPRTGTAHKVEILRTINNKKSVARDRSPIETFTAAEKK